MTITETILLLLFAGFISSSVASFIGLGGGLVAIPIIILAIGDHTTQAKLISVLSIIVISIVGTIKYSQQKRSPKYKIASWVLLGVIPAATVSHLYIGSVLQNYKTIYHSLYLSIAALVTILVLYKDRLSFQVPNYILPLFGALIGMASGILGISGGVLFIPLLVCVVGVSIKDAASTSLALKAVTSFVYIGVSIGANEFPSLNDISYNLHWYYVLILLVGTVCGSLIGPKLNNITPTKYVKYLFFLVMFLVIMNEILKISNVY